MDKKNRRQTEHVNNSNGSKRKYRQNNKTREILHGNCEQQVTHNDEQQKKFFYSSELI